MKKIILLLPVIFIATACTTPKTMLKNPQTGQVVECGGSATGSLVGGAIGYHIQKGNDATCVSDYEQQGFKSIKTDESSTPSK